MGFMKISRFVHFREFGAFRLRVGLEVWEAYLVELEVVLQQVESISNNCSIARYQYFILK